MASVNAWRDHHQASMNASAGGNSLDDDSKSDLRLLEDSASSDGGLGDGNGGGTKRSRGDSQGGDSRDEFRHKRIITTPRRKSQQSQILFACGCPRRHCVDCDS